VAPIKTFVTTGIIALVTAIFLTMPSVVGATERVTAKKKATATAKASSNGRASKNAGPRSARRVNTRQVASVVRLEPAHASFGQMYGLHNTADSLDLKSSVALVLDQDTNEVLFSKNSQAVLPIASLTKLMTALVVTEAKLPLDEMLTVTQDDVDTEKGSRSRLRVGTTLSREEMLHLALMSSENRAAHALGRYYPGGLDAFVEAMNGKAQSLGMVDTHYVEPTGLSSRNQSSARDLAALVKAAHEHQIIRDFSTSPEYEVELGNRPAQFRTTNSLVKSPLWEIGLQKTGFINEAGRCLVMQAKLAGRQLIMVFLDSAGKYSRLGDAERVRRWISSEVPVQVHAPAAEVAVKAAS
jgi:D-alanyl-D-alanine endopeptidase (penicillin-binding protein 7)